MADVTPDPSSGGSATDWSGALRAIRRRMASSQVSFLPVVVGLVSIWVIFTVASDGVFLRPQNLVNLSMQMAATGTIAIGMVLVLLLAEIDLSMGIVSGLAGAVMGVVSVQLGMPGVVAVGAALAVGAAIGCFQGLWITRFAIPSFVVTLAGLIAWEGAKLWVLGVNGTINIRDTFITGFSRNFFDGPGAWLVGLLLVGYAAYSILGRRRRRVAAGLPVDPPLTPVILLAATCAVVAIVVFTLEQDRGMAYSVVVFLALLVVLDLVTRRTRFGRMIFAVGGNPESAARAGIRVPRVRVAVFTLASVLAALGGVLAASRLLAVSQSAGSADVLLNAIAAAVIGGTSLFGGRGSVWSALLGILVIQSISNGMDLLAFEPSVKQMVTGAVLLAAVTVDAIARRGQATGRPSLFARAFRRGVA